MQFAYLMCVYVSQQYIIRSEERRVGKRIMMGARKRIRMVVEEQAREEIGDWFGCSVTREAMDRVQRSTDQWV